MLIAIHRVKLFTCNEASCSLLYMEWHFALIVIHGVKLYANCYTWSEALCSMLYMN